MTIAVQISLAETGNNVSGNFNYQCFTLLAADHPRDHFIFIFDSQYDPSIIVHSNITPVLLGPQMKNSLLQHYWYNFKLPRVLNKYNASVFVSSNPICCIRTEAEQFIHINETVLFNKADQSRYLKKNIRQFITLADTVIVPDIFIKNKLISLYKEAGQKTILVPRGTREDIIPITFDEKTAVKEYFTKGVEFFVYYDTGTGIEKTIAVLKAFSLFKKWQQSGMNLVIVTSTGKETKLKKSLSSYKFREHVKLVTGNEKIKEIFSSAYAALFLPGNEKIEQEMLALLKSGTPLIVDETEYYKSFFGNAVVYTTPNEKSISEKLMLLYKDENQRNKHIAAGQALAGTLSWQHSARELWQAIIPVTEP